MPESLTELSEKADQVKGLVSLVQLDVMDGLFVPSKSWPYRKSQSEEFKTLLRHGGGLPFWEDIEYGIDLMVEHPEEVIKDWIALGARRIVVHVEGVKNVRDTISFVEEHSLKRGEEFAGSADIECGLAFSINTPLEQLRHYIHDIAFVQLMGIEKIGYQGQPFAPKVIERVRYLREEYPHLIISVDGGVNLETAPALVRAGATRLVSGSAVFESGDIKDTLRRLGESY